jgi:hypothetical protein
MRNPDQTLADALLGGVNFYFAIGAFDTLCDGGARTLRGGFSRMMADRWRIRVLRVTRVSLQ